MSLTSVKNQDTCNCCEADLPAPRVSNRPGLPALAYRIGVHPTFLQRMLARLAITPGLEKLTTRASDDPAIALLDAWAIVADVLTFYQERIANEAFLRTATERRSVLELAREIGYECKPGVAANAFLAFTVEDAAGAPGVATVPQGTKVQSIPAQGQLPQTFETSGAITAHAEWNALKPRLTRPQELAIRENQLVLMGLSAQFDPATPGLVIADATDFYPLDPMLALPGGQITAVPVQQIYIASTNTNLKAGELLLLVGSRSTDAKDLKSLTLRITRVAVETSLQRTRLDLADRPAVPSFVPVFSQIAKISLNSISLNGTQVGNNIVGQMWHERDLSAFLSIQGWDAASVTRYVNTPPPPPLPPADFGAFALRANVGFFGNNAPFHGSLLDAKGNAIYQCDWDRASGWEIWKDSLSADCNNPDNYSDADAYLERSFPDVLPNSWAVFERPTNVFKVYRVAEAIQSSLAGFGISSRATGLKLANPDGSPPDKPADFKVRKSTAHVQSEQLNLAPLPIDAPIAAGETLLQLGQMVLGLQVGQALVLGGERADLPNVTASEIVILSDIVHSGGFTTLTFQSGLQNSYVRETVSLNANIVLATHGETVDEVLGGGDASQPNQRLGLKKPPLTYTSAATASGTQSTLQVHVNEVLWDEAPQLYGLGPRAQEYIVRIDDDGKTSVIFGDGTMGARPPTGTENIKATYRSGIGLAGMMAAAQLTLLQTRPLGIRGVTNPLAATGAADPEDRDSARSNAPLTVLTLDRIVSLRDFEDFARAFAGIGKAQAVPLWLGETRLVHITIAAAASSGGSSALATNVVDPSSPLYTNLVSAIQSSGDPSQQFAVDTYRPLFFNVTARVWIDRRYIASEVLAAVEKALQSAFAFQTRGFGQPVTSAEVITVIQNVPGVVATDLSQFYRYEDNAQPPDQNVEITPELLEAQPARVENNSIQIAELLLVNPVGIRLVEMKP